jgi:hypothetical protein
MMAIFVNFSNSACQTSPHTLTLAHQSCCNHVLLKSHTLAFNFNSVALTSLLLVGPCHHGMARLRVADGGTACSM